jgi:hypothetical protein
MSDLLCQNENELEERADFLTDDEINEWTISTSKFRQLVSTAQGKGAHLFVGPRGCGKTHLFRHAYLNCHKIKVFSVYVTYGKYYHLEPLLSKKANATRVFHAWILSRLLVGIKDAITYYTKSTGKIIVEELIDPWLNEDNITAIEKFINYAEKGIVGSDEKSEMILKDLSINVILKIIQKIVTHLKCHHTVIFLDDAALTLTPEYLVEFFEVFRNLKSKEVSPKAAVYPGTTYGPRLHVGQDAKEVNIWEIEFNNSDTIINQLPETSRLNMLTNDILKEILSLLKIASFGIPRAFINLVRYYCVEKGSPQKKFNAALETHSELLLKEFKTMQHKLPPYASVIEIGNSLFLSIVNELRKKNLDLIKTNKKQIVIGIQQENSDKDVLINRMFAFLIEAGLLFPKGEVSHGDNRKYNRYTPHIAFLLKEKAFSSKSRGFNPTEILDFLNRVDEKHPERTKFSSLVNDIEKIQLDLPPCTNCGTPRSFESQKFCHHCGFELVNESKYKKCMEMSIKALPLTRWRIAKILETKLKTVGDIVSHENVASELRKPKGIGPRRAEETFEKTIAYIEEFLS